MRILMLAQFYAPDIGGEERHVQDLSHELVKRGHQVAVATIYHPQRAKFENDRGVRVHRIRSTMSRIGRLYQENGRLHAPSFPDPELAIELWKVIERERPDVIHAHNWMFYSLLPYRIWNHIPTILTLHDYSLVCAKKRLMYRGEPCEGPELIKCLQCASNHYGILKGTTTVVTMNALKPAQVKSVDMFLAVSRATAIGNELAGSGLPYQVIPNFVPDDIQETDRDDASDPRLAQLPTDGYLLFVGDMSQDKGIEILLKAYAGLKDVPSLVLIGRSYGALSNLPSNVIYMGSWPHELIMEAWRRCSIALAPSIWPEPFGIVAIEAMSCSRPVIASRIGGLIDIVEDGVSGFLIPPGDVAALQSAIRTLVDNPELRETMGMSAKMRVNRFKARSIVPQIEHVYGELIKVKRVPKKIRLIDDQETGVIKD
ncbi:MAG: glycosyltransferase family 4 protein [Omnitrophica WOR_2 bacterium]